MVDKEALNRHLKELVQKHDSKISRTAIETLLKIHRNILYNEGNVHFRCIKPDNPNFNEKVWSLTPARTFMKQCGWMHVHNRFLFNNDAALVDVIEILLQYRNVQPQGYEWVEDTKIITKSAEKQRDEELRKKAALERDKELAEFQKEKKYREDIAERVRADAKADTKRKKELYGK